MRVKYLTLAAILGSSIFFSACDDLGIDPEVGIADCLTEEDRTNYSLFVANEKAAVSLLEEHGMVPGDVPSSERDELKDVILENIDEHNTLRKGFDCQYWGEDVDFLDLIATNGTEIDPDVLNAESFKSLFKIESSEVLEALSEDDWIGQDVYVFPGISRIPWEGASQANKEEALRRINEAYNNLRQSKGLEDEVELFDPVNDYLYPHASFHQVFMVQYQSVLNDPNNVNAKGIVTSMTSVEEAIMEKLISRSPDSL